MPQLITGSEAAKAISDEQKAARSRGSYLDQQKFPDGKEVFLRPYTEHTSWINIATHNYIPTKPKPAQLAEKDNWPPTMWAVCQNHKTFMNTDPQTGQPVPGSFEEGYGECWIDANLVGQISGRYEKKLWVPDHVIYGIFVVREPVFGEGGRLVGLKDEMVEHKDKAGTTTQVPHLVLCVQKWSNFYGAIKTASYVDGTVTNKDFVVQRNGTDYKIQALPQVGAPHSPDTESWKVYGQTLELLGFDLSKYILEHATPDHYKRYFIPGAEPAGGYTRGKSGDDAGETGTAAASAGPGPTEPVQPQGVDDDVLAQFRKDLDQSRAQKA